MLSLSSWLHRGARVRRPSARPRLEPLDDRVTPAVSITLNPVTLNAVEGAAVTGTVATFTTTDPAAVAGNFTATIDWRDGTASPASGQPVTIVADPVTAGLFDVVSTHTFAEEGAINLTVNVTDIVNSVSSTSAFFSQTNLVTDNQSVLTGLGFTAALHTDANLINPWGVSFAPTGPSWVSDNGAGVSTLYDGTGAALPLVVTIPPSANAGATSPAPVTGQVFNASSTDFLVAGPGTAAHFIFATEDGTIAAWNSGTSAALMVDNTDFVNGPVYKGLAIGNNGTGTFLYAANFRGHTIDVFGSTFSKATLGAGGFGTFTDPNADIAGFSPFNIQNINNKLYVTYALPDAGGKDDVSGAGNGFVDVFDLSGNFLQRLATQGTLDSPWGLALAPTTFGAFAGDVLVGNFGDGHINAFDATTGAFKGQLNDAQNQPITIDGLWALSFGNNGAAGPAGTLFFTAGINDEADGLFGSLRAVDSSIATVADAALLPGIVVSGAAAEFAGVGGNNTSTNAGTANAALAEFEAAVGGANNGGTGTPATGGFRTITWDGVPLDGTDTGFSDVVIDSGHVVGIPLNRFQERGVSFEQVYAVSGPASDTDTSTFTTVNPTVTNLFKAFSPTKTFAMFNDNTIDFSFVLASNHATAPVPAATQGFGAIFENVRLPNTTSIEYFNGDTSLGKFFVPVGTAGQAEFLGELFASPIVTRVSITLGTDVLFSFDGVHFRAGTQPDDPTNGHNLVVTDDFVYAEPVPLTTSQPIVKLNEGATFSGAVATFSDLNPNAAVTDFTATINWGDGHTTTGTIAAVGGQFTVSGTHSYATAGSFNISVLVQDVGGSQVTVTNTAVVHPLYLVAGADQGQTSHVKVFDALSGALKLDFLAYGPSFAGGVHVATGDVDGDGIPDIITGAGPTGGPHVKVFSGVDAHLMASFFAYNPSFAGGVYVAAGDVNGDGMADVITGAGSGGGPHVKVVDATKLDKLQTSGQISDASLLQNFFAYSAAFTGGVRVAAGAVDADNLADVITGAGTGGGPHVRVFSGGNPANVIANFYAFASTYTGGIYVAAGDLNGDGRADIVAGQGQGVAAQVSTFSGVDFHQMGNVIPFVPPPGGAGSAVDGVRVAAVDRDSDGLADVVVGTGTSKASIVASFKGTTLVPLGQFAAFDPSFLGGVFVG